MPCLDSIALERTLPCLADPGRIVVVGIPSQLLDEVLPYLATLPNVIAYNPEAKTLTFRRNPGFLTLYADRVFITQVRDHEEGTMLLAALVDAINATWEQRHELVAVMTQRRSLRPLDVWTLLPQTNCKQCQEATCMAFAFALIQHLRSVDECPPLRDDAGLADRRSALDAML